MNNCIDRSIIIKIKSVIFKHIKESPEYKFFIFWSRVDWNCRDLSDYDIWVISDKPLDSLIKLEIEEDFENIPALIDFIDFYKVNENFKKEAMKNIIWLN